MTDGMLTSQEMLNEYRNKKKHSEASVLVFEGVPGYDVYNITAPFESNHGLVIAGRVEKRESEKSTIAFFKETVENHWQKIEGLPELHLQDPFVTVIDSELVLGGVEVFFGDNPTEVKWRTCFYKGQTLEELTLFFEGPLGMKDLRFKQLNDGRILVLTRPQGAKGGRGKIGVTLIKQLSEINQQLIEEAPLLLNQFTEEEWGGANEIHQLTDNTVGVLGHIANFDSAGNRHYYAFSFILELTTFTISHEKIMAERADFKKGPTKRPDLSDVVFSGGLVLTEKSATLHAGISDAGAQKITCNHPFKED